jgi:hypothetical protein
MTVVAIAFVIVTRRVLGTASVQGLGRATWAGLAAAGGSGVVGAAISLAIPMHHKLTELAAGAVAAIVVVIVFGAIAFRLDDGDLGVILARVLRVTGLPLPQQPDGGRLGPGFLRALSRSVRQRAGEQPWPYRSGRTAGTDTAENGDARRAEPGDRRPRKLSARGRQLAIAIGLIAGGTGGYAVFASSNEAGTVLLLLIALILLLVGIEGTPLLWFAVRPRAHRTGKRRLDIPAQRIVPPSEPLIVSMPDDLAVPEGLLTGPPAISATGAEDGTSLYTTD